MNTQKTILIAEDEEFNFILLEEYLTRRNYSVVHAKNGLEAVAKIKENQNYCLIFMDIRMPEMDGIQAAQIIRTLNPQIPIVAHTAYATNEDVQQYRDVFDAYLTKPIKFNQVDEILARFVPK